MLRIALYFASANAFFAGCVLLTVGAVLRMIFRRRWVVWTARACVGLGIVFVALSSTPWYLWVYTLWAAMALWLLLDPYRRKRADVFRVYLVPLIVIGVSVYGFMRETRHRQAPRPATARPTCVVVIGDSISAELGKDVTPWPELIRKKYGVKVVNLSAKGATQIDAVEAAHEVDFDELRACTVVLEIGGNDILGRCKGGKFREELEQLLYVVSRPKNTVYLFELPLVPFQNQYGMAQRRLADRYGTTLIPKNYLARVLNHAKNGMHLTQKGQEEMAEMVWKIIAPPEQAG